ncbi:MAG: Rieske 2Fe-2S domain-containing protein [Anaerolineaceae bacterium]|nr:Rieske 2Fe-2S domain-containing protein [Anaerolineaceae bacterium]
MNREIEQTTTKPVTRRNFLKVVWGMAGALAAAQAGGVVLSFLSPRTAAGEFGGVIEAGQAVDFPTGSVTPFTNGRFYLVRMDDGGFIALYRKCSHLGCTVPWDQAQGKFVCPCHASAFEMNGQVLNTPAPRPLDRFPVTIENGVVTVNTGEIIQRDQASAADLVYVEGGG